MPHHSTSRAAHGPKFPIHFQRVSYHPAGTRARATFRVVICVAAALFGAAACGRGAPTAADLPETAPQLVTPHVAALELVPTTTGTGRALTVRVRLNDPRVTLGSSDRLALSVASGTGDAEVVRAEPAICLRGDAEYRCRGFMLLMRSGHTIAEITSRLPEIGGRIAITAFAGEFASIDIAASGDAALDAAMRRARGWPNVRVVELIPIGRLTAGPPPPAAHVVIPLDVTTDVARAVAGDGRLQVAAAGTIHVSYRQLTGEILTASVTLP